jgi:hypothetical protein
MKTLIDLTMDADDELTAWQEVQAMDAVLLQREKNLNHRCPPDMPPCPECQQKDDDEQ